jgi:hypothetical protein
MKHRVIVKKDKIGSMKFFPQVRLWFIWFSMRNSYDDIIGRDSIENAYLEVLSDYKDRQSRKYATSKVVMIKFEKEKKAFNLDKEEIPNTKTLMY